MIPKIEYGRKDIQIGHVFEISNWLVHCTYSSVQVLRFTLFSGSNEMELQKFVNKPMRQPWRILKINFTMDVEGSGKAINEIFYLLDDYIKPKNRYDRSGKT